MRPLVARDLSEATIDPAGVSGGDEIVLGELGESSGVERVFDVLQCEGELEDLNIWDR